MDPAKCPWFATLKRTAEIGGHVFMTHWGDGETRRTLALDCDSGEIGTAFRAGLPRRYRVGLFDPEGPRIATRTATRKMLQEWRRTGELERRQRHLRSLFEPGWLTGGADGPSP
jgi:hypothetical protein